MDVSQSDISSPNKRFRQFREQMNLKRRELAELIGRTYQAIKDMEDGKSGISTEHIKKISEKYRLNPSWLINGEGEMLMADTTHSASVTGNFIPGKRELSKIIEDISRNLHPDHLPLVEALKEEIFKLIEEKDQLSLKHTKLLEELNELYKRI